MRTVFKSFIVLLFVIPALFLGGYNASANDGFGTVFGAVVGALLGGHLEHSRHRNNHATMNGTYSRQYRQRNLGSHHLGYVTLGGHHYLGRRYYHYGSYSRCHQVLQPTIISGRVYQVYRMVCPDHHGLWRIVR